MGASGRRYDTPKTKPKPTIQPMTAAFRARFLVPIALLFALSVGCGESTQDKFLRIAKERAAARAAERADEAAKEAAAPATEAVAQKTTPTPESETPKPPTADKSAADKSTADKSAAVETTSTAANQAPKPDVNNVSAKGPPPEATPAAVVVTPVASLPRRDQVLAFSRLGTQVAFVGSSQSIGVYDVGTKKVQRQLYNPELSPFSLAISENGKLLAAGGVDGGLKVFPLDSIDGLDRFQQNRLLRQDAAPPRQAHEGPVSAVAVNDSVGIVATGGADGQIKLWSTRSEPTLQLTGAGADSVGLLSYQDDQLLFSANADGVSYWQIGKLETEASSFSGQAFTQPPTAMIPGPDGKGLAVGDAGGRVTLWTPENETLKQSAFAAHGSAIDSLGLADGGESLVTVARDGDIAKWNLPIAQQRTFDIVEPARLVVVSPDGRYIGVPSRETNFDLYSVADGRAVRRHSIGQGKLTAADFSSDAGLVALADASGRVYFQDETRRPIAYRDLAGAAVDQLRHVSGTNGMVFSSSSGTLGMVELPDLRGTSIGNVSGELVAPNRSGTSMIVARGSDVRLVRPSDGRIIRSAKIADGTATAIAMDENFAMVGTSTGSVFVWSFLGADVGLDAIAKNAHPGPVIAIGATAQGSVWTCDQSGACKLTPLKRQASVETGKLGFAPEQIVSLEDGVLFAIDGDGNLRQSPALDKEFQTVENQSGNVLVDGSTRVALIAAKGNAVSILSADASKITSAQTAGDTTFESVSLSRDTLVARVSDGSALAISTPSGKSVQRDLPGGEIRNLVSSPDGRLWVFRDGSGDLYSSSTLGNGRKLNLPGQSNAQPLALSRDGRFLVVATSGRTLCYEVGRSSPRLAAVFPDDIVNPTTATFSADAKRVLLTMPDLRVLSASLTKGDEVVDLGKTGQLATESAIDVPSKTLVIRDSAGVVSIRSVVDGTIKAEFGETKIVAMATAGQAVCLASEDGGLFRINPADATMVRFASTEMTEPIAAMAFGRTGTAGAGDSAGNEDGVIALATSTGKVVMVSEKSGVRWTIDPTAEKISPMALAISADQLSMLDLSGKLSIASSGSVSTLAPKDSGLKRLAISRDGKHVLGVRDSGALIRWAWANGRFAAPEAVTEPASASDIMPIGRADAFAVITGDGNDTLVRYSASSKTISATIAGSTNITELVVGGGGDVVLAKTAKGLVAADFRRGSIDSVRDELASNAADGFFLSSGQGARDRWTSVAKDGQFANSDRLSDQDSAGSFELETKPTRVIIAGGLMVAAGEELIRIVRDDGKEFGRLPMPSGQLASLAVHAGSGNVAACGLDGSLVIRVAAGGEVKRSSLPIPNPTSMVWSQDGNEIAATNGDRMVLVDAKTAKVTSQCLVASKLDSLVHWDQDKIWYVDPSSRLASVRPPSVAWTVSIGERASDVAVDERGEFVFASTASGTLIKYDAATGEEIKRITTGRTNLRELTPIPNSQRAAFLAGNSDIYLLDGDGTVAEYPSLSALGLRSLAVSVDSRFLFASNDGGQILSWDLSKAGGQPSMVPCEIEAAELSLVGGGELVASSSDEARIAILSSSMRVNVVAQAGNQMADSDVSPNGQFATIADRSDKIQMISLTGGINRELMSEGNAFGTVVVHPSATHVAALGTNQFDDGGRLVVWETVDLKQTGAANLDVGAKLLSYSRDGSLIAVGFDDGHVEVFDASSAKRLESLPRIDGLESIAFSQDGSKLLLARSGGMVEIESLKSLGQATASGSAIVSLGFHGGGKYLLCGTMKGEMTLWNRAAFSSPQAAFQGLADPVIQTAVSSDGRYALAVYDDAESSTMVWDLNATTGTSTQIEPKLVVRSDVKSSTASFTSDSEFLLIGGIDGVIRAWSLSEGREVARFRGHDGPVMDIAPLSEPGRFVSGGVDHSIRSWKFPSSLPSPGAEIPQGALADATEVQDLAPPTIDGDADKADPFDAARQALIAGAGTADILDLMKGAQEVKEDVKASLNRVLSMEKNGSVSAADLSKERRRLAMTQRKLDPSDNGQSLSSYSDGFSNLTFVGITNFKFGLDKTYRPVKLMFADRFLYAARPSAPKVRKKEDEEKIDEGDNGALLSWDYRYSGLQAHAWSTEDLNVRELFPLRDSGGVFTVPQMMLFNQDGSSRRLASVASWAMSNAAPPQRQYLAVGTAGARRSEDDILKVFDITDFADEQVAPYSQYRSFEGVVTAMAFANNSSTIAFSVRERAVHRLFIADAETLRVQKLEEYNHSEPYWDLDGANGNVRPNSKAAPGVTTLAFSPDDQTLLAHGNYKKDLYKLSTWKIQWDSPGDMLSFEKNRKELENEDGPFFVESGNPSVRFVAKPGETSNFRRILVRVRSGFSLINLSSERSEQTIGFVSTQHGVPEHAVTDDGRWIVMGDDNGMAYIWDTLKGDRYSLTMTDEIEQRMLETQAKIRDIRERPAHSGPIVGVALSDPDPGQDYPAFAATIGEENKLKVWELFPILDPETGLRARN